MRMYSSARDPRRNHSRGSFYPVSHRTGCIRPPSPPRPRRRRRLSKSPPCPRQGMRPPPWRSTPPLQCRCRRHCRSRPCRRNLDDVTTTPLILSLYNLFRSHDHRELQYFISESRPPRHYLTTCIHHLWVACLRRPPSFFFFLFSFPNHIHSLPGDMFVTCPIIQIYFTAIFRIPFIPFKSFYLPHPSSLSTCHLASRGSM